MTGVRVMGVALLLLASCTNTPQPATTTIDDQPAPPTSFPSGAGQQIRTVYDYEPDTTLSYDLSVVQDIEFSVAGDESSLMGADESLPTEGEVMSTGETVIDYHILTQSTENAATIDILASFPEVTTNATIDGEDLEPGEYDALTEALAAIQPIDFRLTVNDRNAVLSTGGEGGLDVLSGEVGALTSLSNNQLSRPLGPVFPEDRSLRVGQEWRIESTQEGPQGPIVVSATHRLAGIVAVDGRDLLRIESINETDGFELDFSEVFQSLFAGFASGASGEAVTEEDLAEFADVRFVIGVQPSIGTATTLFDPTAGRVISTDQESTVRLRWILQTPDDQTGEITGFELMLDITQTAEFDLR